MQLSKHFSLSELCRSYTATRLGIDNSPPLSVIGPLTDLAVNVLQPIRNHFRKPVRVNSGYRCSALNTAIQGAQNSQHLLGEAADIEIPGVDNQKLGLWIEKNLDFDQLIYCRAEDPVAGWIHVSFRAGKNRRQVLRVQQ